LYLAPGDSVQLTARGPVVDAHQNPLADTTLARTILSSIQWTYDPWLNVTVSSTGLVRANAPSFVGAVYPGMLQNGDVVPLGSCTIVIQ
jgi:poly-beta-hydroxyalkanoate depolymerase